MPRLPLRYRCGLLAFLGTFAGLDSARASAADPIALTNTRPLEMSGDLSAPMLTGINRFLQRELAHSVSRRAEHWQRNRATAEAYQQSVYSNRERFRTLIGAVDERPTRTELEYVATTTAPALIAETATYRVLAVRWRAFGHVHGEGLLLQPKGPPRARLVALPDADQTPEMLAGLTPGIAPDSQVARRLAESGAQVIIPTLVDRRDEWSGNTPLNRFTNQPHREWIYRPAYQIGRHIIGYEVQKVLAAVDWFTQENDSTAHLPIGVTGNTEGGLIALYAAALDPRIDATLVSSYFDSRQAVAEEPIYRNVFALLHEFGDAEIASLIAPRALVIEASLAPEISGPPLPRTGRAGAAPGVISTPRAASVQAEFTRTQALCGPALSRRFHLIDASDGATPPLPGSPPALAAFWSELTADRTPLATTQTPLVTNSRIPEVDARQRRQVAELEAHTQGLVQLAHHDRNAFFWKKLKPESAAGWTVAIQPFKAIFWDEVIGRLPGPDLPANARSRPLLDRPTWTAHDVVLDVRPDIFAWGVLLLPKDLKPGERRPVVVCQHGLEGVPADTFAEDPALRVSGIYQAFAARLVERGFIVFAPHNPYRGGEDFRRLTRVLNPLKQTLFSVILEQHEQILKWLSAQPYVDPQRIGFYGLSYGGKTAMRVPALLDGYALSICSADFNDWLKKTTSIDGPPSYLFTREYEISEFNHGRTFNYAEMAALIAPRPFMVERGHNDGVAPDEWVAFEYAKVRRLYAQLQIPERTTIEYFNGPHAIHGVGTFDFLHTHLNWPVR
jgi:dienelactone hydrolase